MKRGERGKEDSVSEEKTKRNAGRREKKGGMQQSGWKRKRVCVSCEWESMLAKKKKKKVNSNESSQV